LFIIVFAFIEIDSWKVFRGLQDYFVALTCGGSFIKDHDLFLSSQAGKTPIQLAAQKGNRAAVEILFSKTSKIKTIPWSVDGITVHMQAECGDKQVLRSLLRAAFSYFILLHVNVVQISKF